MRGWALTVCKWPFASLAGSAQKQSERSGRTRNLRVRAFVKAARNRSHNRWAFVKALLVAFRKLFACVGERKKIGGSGST